MITQNKSYGEIKVRSRIFPKDAREIVNKGKVRIVAVQTDPSPKTKQIFLDAGISLYCAITPAEVAAIRKEVKLAFNRRVE